VEKVGGHSSICMHMVTPFWLLQKKRRRRREREK